MLSQNVLVLSCVLLLLTLCPDVLSRRGFGGIGGRWGGIRKAGGGGGARRGGEARGIGGGPHYKVAHANGGSSSSGSSAGKMAGAAVAGAVGGMMIGHGQSSMSRYGRGGYGGYGGYGYGGGHGQVRYDNGAGFRNETYMEYYTGAASRGHTYSCVLLFGATVSLLIRF